MFNFFKYAILLMLSACTIDGEVSEKSLNRVMLCKDTRDGETFYYNTDTIKNVRIGFLSPSTYEITTLDGRTTTLSQTMESWLKCEEVK